jgi:hypothetical protein
MNNTKHKRNEAATPASRWATIKTGKGQVTGYIEVFRTTGAQYVTIPGVSRFRDVSRTSESDARLEAR